MYCNLFKTWYYKYVRKIIKRKKENEVNTMTREEAIAGRLSQREGVFGKSGVIDRKKQIKEATKELRALAMMINESLDENDFDDVYGLGIEIRRLGNNICNIADDTLKPFDED